MAMHLLPFSSCLLVLLYFVCAMNAQSEEVDYELSTFCRVYKDGRVERLMFTETVPPGFDPQTKVTSKDILILPDFNVSARFYLPKLTNPHQKLPLMVYFHGGAFCAGHPSTPRFHDHLNLLASQANVVAVHVDYRLVPEYHLPIAYEDSWAALKWIASHSQGQGPETWLNKFVNFNKVYLAGDSAGGNIVHNLAILAGDSNSDLNMSIHGAALVHPYFWGSVAIGNEANNLTIKANIDGLWARFCPSSPSTDDPRANPFADGAPSLSTLGCRKVLVFVAELDIFRDRGQLYYETLSSSGWEGDAEIDEAEGVGHVFHLFDPTSAKAKHLVKRLANFLN